MASRRSRRLAGEDSGVEWARSARADPVVSLAPLNPVQPPAAVQTKPGPSRPVAAVAPAVPWRMRVSCCMAAAFAVRLVLLAFAEWQDANLVVKYTDIDYIVFTDAARFVSQGQSPYERSTYRYSPLLAWLLVPNVRLHPVFGKLLFAALDLVAGELTRRILVARGVGSAEALKYACCWLFNPLAINMSTRGSCESITAVLLLGTLLATVRGKITAAALMYGAAVHFRIFPIFYAPAFLWFFGPRGSSLFRGLFSLNGFYFGACSALSFLGLGAGCYAAYGAEFLEHSYFYHLVRQDTRHNFSIYFYYLYLQGSQGAARDAGSMLLSLGCFLPQVGVILVAARRLAADLPFCLFVQTFVFVIFNKVVTAQYFVWYVSLLPLLLPFSRIKLRWEGVSMIAVFFGAEIVWGLAAYKIEFSGQSNFLAVWAAGLLFFCAQVWLLLAVIYTQQFTPFTHKGLERVSGSSRSM